MQLAVNSFEIQALIDNRLDTRTAAITYGKIMMDPSSFNFYKQLVAQKELLVQWYNETVSVH